MKTIRLADLATFVTSKNAGPFLLTLDVVFPDVDTYNRVKASGAINSTSIASLYGIPIEHIVKVVNFDPANAIKVTFRRPLASGAVGDSDVYGAQQHVPFMQLEIPWESGDGNAS